MNTDSRLNMEQQEEADEFDFDAENKAIAERWHSLNFIRTQNGGFSNVPVIFGAITRRGNIWRGIGTVQS